MNLMEAFEFHTLRSSAASGFRPKPCIGAIGQDGVVRHSKWGEQMTNSIRQKGLNFVVEMGL